MNLIESLNITEFTLAEKIFMAKIKLTDFHAQPHGFVNGGVILAFAEIAAGHASQQLQTDHYAVGQSVTGHHLKAKKSHGELIAQGELLHKGKRSHVWNIRMLDEENNLISQVSVINALIEKK